MAVHINGYWIREGAIWNFENFKGHDTKSNVLIFPSLHSSPLIVVIFKIWNKFNNIRKTTNNVGIGGHGSVHGAIRLKIGA